MAKDSYDHTEIEKKVQAQWAALDLYKTDLNDAEKDPYYLLVEFPYPSGDLHIGHWYAFALTDIFARFLRMRGKNVLFPFGFDAFGLPAENAAIRNKLDPKEWTYKNMEKMRGQMAQMGASFDWSKEVITCDPAYYKWTQWLFSKFYEHGLAEHRMAAVKWCPHDMTVLANEQVIDGRCERCGHEVVEKNLTQWFLKITQYAKRLLTDIEPLPWPREIKDAQKAWIGESEGARIFFDVHSIQNDEAGVIEVFTTRPDTIFGATYVVLAPEHSLVETYLPMTLNRKDVEAYRTATSRKTERERSENKEKTGVKLEGIMAVNPANNQEIPIFVADYVLASYGTGAVMAVPAHDERDFEFAAAQNELHPQSADKYLIFDFDGVIGNTFEHSVKAQVTMGHMPDLDAARVEVLDYARNKPIHTRDHSLTPEQIEKEYEWTSRFGEAMSKNKIELFNEFIDEVIKIPNAKIAVVSSGSNKYVGPAIKKSKLKPSHVLSFEDHHSKEEKIERIAKDWGVSVRDVSYFTDTKADYYELNEFLGSKKLYGCAWGYLGGKELEEVMPREQILENYADIHQVLEGFDAQPFLSSVQVVVPQVIDQGNPPQEGKENTERNVTIAIVHDPKTDTYLCLKWKKQSWTTFITGGIEDGENAIEAAVREIREETGYRNVKLVRELGGLSESQFFAAHKDVNRKVRSQAILFELQNDERDDVAQEELEQYDIAWLSKEEVESAGMQHAEFDMLWHRILTGDDAYTGAGVLINSEQFNGRNSEEAMWDIVAHVQGERVTQYRLRDWLVSRQRYWGCPIPIVYDPEGNPHLVPAEHLPWLLPEDVDFTPTGKSPLATSKELQERVERIFGAGWTPEYDTLDVFVDSSWYFTRYLDSKDEHDFSDQALMKKWLPVNRYTGGAEHTTVHLLYARFFYKVLHDLDLVPTSEPFYERFNRGLILGPDNAKMSKSKGNVINPDEVVAKYGADAVRMYLAFVGPYNEPGSYPWNLDGTEAIRRFLDRTARLASNVSDDAPTPELARALAKATQKVGQDIERFKYNTAISALMIAIKEFEKNNAVPKSAYLNFLKLLAPFAPHLSDYLYQSVAGEQTKDMPSIHMLPWPAVDETVLEDEDITITVQVNGKRRASLSIAKGSNELTISAAAREIPTVAAHIGDGRLRIIFVPDRLINFVTDAA